MSIRSEQREFASNLRRSGATWVSIGEALRERYGCNARAALRLAHGWSQHQAAEAWCARWPDDPVTAKTISWWECWPVSGHAPSLSRLSRLAELYECAVADLVADVGDHTHRDLHGDVVGRRAFLGAVVGTVAVVRHPTDGALPRERRAGPGPGRGRIGVADVGRARTALSELYLLDDAQGGAGVVEQAIEHSRRIQQVLHRGSYSLTVGRDLRICQAELTEMVGWLAFDAGRHDVARRHFTEALTTAQVTGSDQLAVLVLASMSLQASTVGAGREAVELADAAQRAARSYAGPRLLSLLAARAALGHACSGEGPAALAALAQAEALLDEDDDRGEAWLAFWGPADFHGTVALAHQALGASHAAERANREALAVTDAAYPRNRSLYLGQLAEALISVGEVDEGSRVAGEALAGVPSGRLRHQLAALRPALDRHRHRAPVAGFLDRLAAGT